MLFERIKLEDDEQLIKIVRKHWFIMFVYTMTAAGLALFPMIAYWLVSFVINSSNTTLAETIGPALGLSSTVWFFYLAWLLLVWMHYTNHITDYFLDLWAITDRRIVAIDQRGYFRRFLSSFRLERLQDMNIEVHGIVPTLLNYGTIEAQTAGGSNEEFKTSNMPDPRGLKALIIKLADERQRVMGLQSGPSDGVS